MSESELAARSVAAVVGKVTAIESASDPATDGVNTYVHIEPAEVVFGSLPAGELVLREVGGRIRGRSEWIFGSPEYRIGAQVLVFLSQNADGSLRTTALSMGKFDIGLGEKGRPTAERRLGEGASVFDLRTGHLDAVAGPEIYSLDELRLAARAGAKSRPSANRRRPAVQLAPPELERLPVREQREAFTYLSTPSRWFEPDDGQPVTFAIDATGDVGVGAASSRAAMNDAFAAWTGVSTSSLVLADGGTLASPIAYAGCSGGNRLVFNDPFNEITDPSSCSGVLAVGGFCSSSETRTVNGTSFRRIRVGKVMFNNGWSSCSGWNRCNMAEVATHELGHTLGFGHSTDLGATMYAAAHFDGRCAGLRSDDIAGATFVYPNLTAASPTPTPTALPPTPTAPPTATASATASATATRTPSAGAPSATATVPSTATATATRTSTAQDTPTHTATSTATVAVPATSTRTPGRRHRVLGRVQYYNADRAVPGTTVNLRGQMLDATQTSDSGDYEFAAVPEGAWELVAEKASDFGSGISPLDAAYVLQTVAQLRTLDPVRRLACDTTGDGQLSALDAARILQFSVGALARLPVAQACGSDWLFLPNPSAAQQQVGIDPEVAAGSCSAGRIMLDNLLDEAPNQDFRAILIGDCTGNWQAPGAPLVRAGSRSPHVRLGRMVVSGAHARLPVYVYSPAPYHALDLQVTYDPDQLTPAAASLRRSSAGGLSSMHVVSAGTLRVAIASGEPIKRRSGALMVIDFTMRDAAGASEPVAVDASIDEQPAVIGE